MSCASEPANKIVVFEGTPRHIGRIFDVRIERASPSTLYGKLDRAFQPPGFAKHPTPQVLFFRGARVCDR